MSRLTKKNSAGQKSLWRIWVIDTIIPAAAVALFIITFIAQLYRIPSGSMEPVLQPGNRILVSKFAYGIRIPFSGRWILQRRAPERGDIIVFLFDNDGRRRNFVKRVIGTPGDRIKIKDGEIYINGIVVDEPPQIPRERYYPIRAGSYGYNEVEVPAGKLFVLGDNAAISSDSRLWGWLCQRKVKGRAVLIVWPPGRVRLISQKDVFFIKQIAATIKTILASQAPITGGSTPFPNNCPRLNKTR
ncbi:MAG: Signal peptidase I S [candidate division WS2 bacterium]|uniref:Signal peptidase I n=1 Tax=Psychracetigena formicireducens TaxID=2986056 RepID=A0A9E2F664_PSYF1|nr:Signal peptidase I S [Candidatus Psychracetigena formicireducens]